MKLNKIVKFGFVLLSICALCCASLLTVHAMKPDRIGYLNENDTETGKIVVYNAAEDAMVISYDGKSVGDYRINGNTAICSYSWGDGLAGYDGYTTKYIFPNDDSLARIMYYLVPQRTPTTPSGRSKSLPDSLKGKTFAWLYTQLGYSFNYNQYFYSNYINTYSDLLVAALFFQNGVNGADANNETVQYIVTHNLVDYFQNMNMYTAPTNAYLHGKPTATEAASNMFIKFFEKYGNSLPNVPNTVKVFAVNPYSNKDTQTLLSIEGIKGYFRIQKQSSDAGITGNNTNYSFSGAEYSWYTTERAAIFAARKVAGGFSAPQDSEYVGYSFLSGSGTTSIYLKGETLSTTTVPVGTYYLVETKAPKGYLLSDEVKKLTIDGSNHAASNRATVTFLETPKLGSLSIVKSPSATSLTENNPLYSLSNAESTIYKDKWLESVYSIVKTNSNGIATLSDIPFGTYYVKETRAPKGFLLDDNTYEVSVTADQSEATVTSTEPVLYKSAPTLIYKQDAKSSAPLPGAKFVVEYYNKEFDNQTYSIDLIPTKKWLFETDSEGLIKLDAAHLVTEYTDSKGNTVPFSNDDFYFSTSDSSTAVLPQGTLRMYEVEAPIVQGTDGNRYKYKLDDTATIQQVADNGNGVVEYKTVTLYNEIEGALTTTFNGEKIWEDNNNANGNRPDEVTISLYKSVNGRAEIVATTTTNEAKNWKYQFDDLPVTEVINGVPYPIIYYVDEEDVPSGYICRIRGTNIINHEKSTKVTVNKVWDDNNNQDGIRPASIIVRLYADSVYTGKYTVLSESNNWTDTFDNLPCMKDKVKINYSVAEYSEETVDTTAYSSTIVSSGNGETNQIFTITNKHTPEKTSVVIKKKWNDVANLDRIRPNSVKVKLDGYVNDSIVYTRIKTLTAYSNATDDPNVWSFTIDDLDKYFDGKPIEYKATELTLVDGYNLDENGEPQTVTATCEEQEDGTFVATLENTHVLQRRSMKVYKVWDDDDNRDGLRPSAVSVYLMTVDGNGDKHRYTDESGNEVIGVIQESNNWQYTFTNLPIYNNEREAIVYSVEEITPSGYTVSYSGGEVNGITITNTHHEKTFVTVNKVWRDGNDQDGIRPDSVTINLKANGTEIDEVELSDDNNWTYTFENLPVHENGQKLWYSVSEDDISVPVEFSNNGYTARLNRTIGSREGYSNYGYIYTVSNTHTPEKRDISVNKVWSDNNNHDGIRPNQVEITLSVVSPSNTGIEDQKGFLSEENNWSYTFKDLPKYHNGQLIQYTVDETDITIEVSSNGYSKRIQGNMDDGFTITNTHRSEKIKLVIDKIWEDDDNLNHTRPDNAEFEVTGAQGQVTSVILNESNNWHYEVRYDKYYDGVEQVPEVKEIHLAEGYVSRKTVERSNRSYVTTYQFTVTNTYEPEPTSIPVTKIWNDNYMHEDTIEGIIVDLYRSPVGSQTNKTLVQSVSLSDENEWQSSFEGFFPRYIDGVEQTYSIQEFSAHYIEELDEYGEETGNMILDKDTNQQNFKRDYVQSIRGNNLDGYTITNTYWSYKNANIPVKKYWDDDNNRDNLRQSIEVVLHGYIGYDVSSGDFSNAIEVSRRYATISADNDWEYTFTDLPALCSEYQAAPLIGNREDYEYEYEYETALTEVSEIYYQIEEINVPNGYSPNNIDGQKFGTGVIVPAQAGSFEDQVETWSYLSAREYNEQYDLHQKYIAWRKTASSYQIAHNTQEWLSIFGLKNTHAVSCTSVKVNKTWEDANNQDGVRPASLTFNLLADGNVYSTVTLNDSNKLSTDPNTWTYTFTNLPVYDNGSEITYSVTEGTVTTPDGFNDYVSMPVESEGDAESGYTFSFTNRYEPETTQYSVVKRWNDNNDLLGKRPDSLLIILKADGVDYMTYTLTQADAGSSAANWSHTFVDLPKYKDGVEIQYTAEEKPDSATERLYKNTLTRTTTDSSGYQTTTFTNKVRTATVVIEKKNHLNISMNGAEFELFLSDGSPLKLSKLQNGRYTYNPSLTTYTNKIDFYTGTVQINNLPTDAIIIAREVTAPNTYFPYDNDIIIDVQQMIKDNSLTDNSAGVYILPAITVNNYKTVMPATGGFGDYAIYILAGMFLIGALIFLKKRKDVDL